MKSSNEQRLSRPGVIRTPTLLSAILISLYGSGLHPRAWCNRQAHRVGRDQHPEGSRFPGRRRLPARSSSFAMATRRRGLRRRCRPPDPDGDASKRPLPHRKPDQDVRRHGSPAARRRGQAALSDSIERWLPGLVPNGNKITVRMLLNHTSGLHDHERDPEVLAPYLSGDLGYYWSPIRLVEVAVLASPLYAPGETKVRRTRAPTTSCSA